MDDYRLNTNKIQHDLLWSFLSAVCIFPCTSSGYHCVPVEPGHLSENLLKDIASKCTCLESLAFET